jgi:tetratricopeptide (TPR) repeat protein
MALDDTRHPDAERLAEYAEDLLNGEHRAEIEHHLADCAACRAAVIETTEFLHSTLAIADSTPRVVPFFSRRRLIGIATGLAAAAALVLAVGAARPDWFLGPRSDRPELQELIAAVANEPTRLAEGRLSGGFKYAPPPSPTRGAGEANVATRVRIAAAKLEQEARERSTPRARAALGVADLAVGDIDGAVRSLESAAALEPSDAHYQNDLAVACIARARRRGAASDWASALAAAERAVAANPALVEAWFNRALAIEGARSADEAQQAWKDYFDRDSSSDWARERRAVDRRD